ncbi:MAG: hypothetical protein R2867_01050 [Caldilineaceae bacterium]
MTEREILNIKRKRIDETMAFYLAQLEATQRKLSELQTERDRIDAQIAAESEGNQ